MIAVYLYDWPMLAGNFAANHNFEDPADCEHEASRKGDSVISEK